MIGRVLDLLRRARENSIWGRGSVSAKDARVVGMLRTTLPRFDIELAIFGLFGYLGGTPALRDTLGDPYARAWSLVVAVTAIVCLVGLAYPKHLWRLEFAGKSLLIGLILLYAVAVVWAGISDNDIGRTAVGIAYLAFLEMPLWRLRDIARDRELNGWH